MSYVSDCLLRFRSLPPDWQEEVGGLNAYRKIITLEKKHGVELGFLVMLLTIGELAFEDIEEYLGKKHNLAAEKSKMISEDLQNEIFAPAIKKLFAPNGPAFFAPEFDLQEEMRNVSSVFESNLTNSLGAGQDYLQDLNVKIFRILNEQPDFEDKILKDLFSNTEKITEKPLIINKKRYIPSVGNWLNDFIKHNGTEIFNNVALTRYIMNSSNCKNLSETEKKLLTKLIILYRNIKFFPESMNGVPMEEWEIFPVERKRDLRSKARQVSGPPRTEEEKEIDELKQEEERYKPGGLERLALEEEIGEKLQADKLRALATRYKEGSLERKAIEEEIRRLGS